LRHLKKKHGILLDEANNENSSQSNGSTASKAAGFIAKNLVTTLKIEKFRYLLLRWIICMHIALNCVESESFRNLIIYISPALEPYLVASGTTIRNWIMKEYGKARLQIQHELANAQSRIHISFDLWTAPNSLAICGIVAHYLGTDLKNHSVLIGMRRVRGRHSGENIAEVIIPVLIEMGLVERLGMFIGDNLESNDVAIRVILKTLRPDIKDPDSRRVRCLGHIINLVAKAFLFGKNEYSFEAEDVNNDPEISYLETMQEAWRKYGPVGRLHNIISFIRDSPQRREEFRDICGNLTAVCDGEIDSNTINAKISANSISR
jgi:hypothetical protein